MTDQPSGGVFLGREHRLPVRVYYEDTDFTGLVYHASYVRFFERGRTEFMRASGIGHRNLLERADPCAFVVTRLDIAFRKAARIDDALLVRTAYDRVRGPRLWVTQIIERGAQLIASAAVEVACITLAGAPRRPPVDLFELIKPRLAET
ncbi:MAG TPA: YbgC/FadM family acyl-CoA thioesterase [Caulobacteraceae bacterium]